MSDATKAVFLSYASQDSEAAKRIADALRAAGVEVWFDQSELVGGDAWDAKIRKQIKDCALLIPIISANTQSRTEGYFRLEWRLADQRTHLMAKGRAFLLPVVIDDTTDADAAVPDSFTEVQWTKAPGGETPPAFGQRVKKLLGGSEMEAGRPRPAERGEVTASPRKPSRPWRMAAGLLLVFIIAALAVKRPWGTSAPAASPAAVSPVAAELARVRARIIPDRWQRQDFEVISSSLDRILQADPEQAEAWALLSIINTLQVTRNQDAGTKPLEAGKSAAERALRLAPGDPLGELALGLHLVAMVSRGGDVRAPRAHIDRAVAGLPSDTLTRYVELVSYWLGFQFEDTERCALAWRAAEPSASFPAWILAQLNMTRRRPAEAEKWAEQAATDSDVTGVRALATMFDARFYLQADLPAARAALDRQKAGGQTVHRVVFNRWLLAMAEHRWDAALQDLARMPEPILFDRNFHGPKALLAGLAHRAAGRPEAMAAQLREAERLAREELARDPDNEELHAVLALTLACAGQKDGARAELATIEPLVGDRAPSVYTGQLLCLIAEARAELGEPDKMLPWLRKLFVEPSALPFTPASVRLNTHFARVIADPGVQALLKEFAALDQPVTAAPKIDDKSVAVLAFANLSDDKANEYFSDGISEELLNVLAKVPGLKVTARTSSFHFKGKDTPIPEIAQQLGVAYVVEGSVRKAGDKVRITAQLIKAADGFHVWSDTFTRDLKDIFAVQDEIAGLIASQLQLKMDLVPARREVNPEAYRFYLEGRQAWNLRTTEGFARADNAYRRALELEPNFARALAGLADVGVVRRSGSGERWAPREEIVSQAERAIALDPSLAEPHATLGVLEFMDWNFEKADRHFQHAFTLNPSYAWAHLWRGQSLFIQGRVDEAMAENQRALDADPLAPRIASNTALFFLLADRPSEALASAERALSLLPGEPQAQTWKAEAMLMLGRVEEALQLVRVTVAHDPKRLDFTYVLASAGTSEEKAAAVAAPDPRFANRTRALLAVGRVEEALAGLEADVKDSVFSFQFVLFHPAFDGVRNDPRFVKMLESLHMTGAHARAQAWRKSHPPEKVEAK